MKIQSRLSILIIAAALCALCASSVWARGRQGGSPGRHAPEVHRQVEKAPGGNGVSPASRPDQSTLENRIEHVPEDRPEIRDRHRRPCRDRALRGVRGRGGCYLVGDEWYEDVTPGSDSGDGAPPAARQGSSANRPAPQASKSPPGDFSTITPSGNDALKNELIAARKNWIAKQEIADDASAAHARAEYQAMQDGTNVAPESAERQRLAREEAAQARQAITPLLERARDSGFAPKTLELYQESLKGY